MRISIIAGVVVAVLAGCASKENRVRISQDKQTPSSAVQEPRLAWRTEPIFYNGKTYQLRFAPADGGIYSMAVLGMGAGQKKDAIAVATSSLRYFKCKDSQKGVLTSGPTYGDAAWKMTVKCG
jgi:hypothetical protein